MASEQIQQVLIASEPDPLNLVASAGRTPANTGLTFNGLACAEPEFAGEITFAENNAVANKFFSRPGRPTLRRGSVALGLYLRSTGETGTFTDQQFTILDACFGKQWTSNSAYTVDTWDSATQVTLTSVANLKVGQGFAVRADSIAHVRFITAIAGLAVTFAPALPASVITAAPATVRGGRTYALARNYAANSSLAAQLRKEAYTVECFGLQGSQFDLPLTTGEMATARVTLAAGYYNPVAGALSVGATDEPAGTWLKFLNADALINGTSRDVHSCKWALNFNPIAKKTPANAAGLIAWENGRPEITCEIELSAFDSAFPTYADNGTEFGVLAHLGTSTVGSAVAVYAPAMHLTEFPEPTAIEDLTALPLKLRAGNYEGDSGSFDTAENTVADSVFRIFFEAGA